MRLSNSTSQSIDTIDSVGNKKQSHENQPMYITTPTEPPPQSLSSQSLPSKLSRILNPQSMSFCIEFQGLQMQINHLRRACGPLFSSKTHPIASSLSWITLQKYVKALKELPKIRFSYIAVSFQVNNIEATVSGNDCIRAYAP